MARSRHAQDLDADPNVAFVEIYVAPGSLGAAETHVRFGYRDGLGVLRQHVETIGVPDSHAIYRAGIQHAAATDTLRLSFKDTANVDGIVWSFQTGTFRDPAHSNDHAFTNSLFHFDRVGAATSTRGSGGDFTGRIHHMRIDRTTCAEGGAIGGPHPCQDSIREDFEDGEFRELQPTVEGWGIRSACAQPPSGAAYWGYETDGCAGYSGRHHAYVHVNLSTATRAQLRFDQLWDHESTEPDDFYVFVRSPDASEQYWWSTQGAHPRRGEWTTLTLDLATFAGTPTPVTIEFIPTSGPMRWLIDDVRLMMVTTNGAPVPIVDAPDNLTGVDANGTRRVDLDGSASYDPDGDPLVLTWRLEGRIVARGPNASVWLPYGTHVVSLGAEDGQGVEMTLDHPVKINQWPNPDVTPWLVNTSDRDGSGSERVRVDGSKSYDPDGHIVNYEWRIRETGAVLASGENESAPTFDFPVGWHNLTLRVTDDNGASSWALARVVVHPNTPPVVSLNVSHDVLDDVESDGEMVTLDGCGSYDPLGTPLRYSWSVNGKPLADETCMVNATLKGASTHVATLTVVDGGDGENTTSATIRLNHLPKADMAVDCYRRNCTFVGSLSTDPDGDTLSYTWEFPWSLTGTGETVTQTFPSNDAFQPCLIVNDSRLHAKTCPIVYPVYHEDFDDGDFRGGERDAGLTGRWGLADASACAPAAPTQPYMLATGPLGCFTSWQGTSVASLDVRLPTTAVDLWVNHSWKLSTRVDLEVVVTNALGVETVLTAWRGAVSSESGGWLAERFDLTAFAGQDVTIGFRSIATAQTNSYWWRIDGIHLAPQGQDAPIQIGTT